MTEEDVRRIVREELAEFKKVNRISVPLTTEQFIEAVGFEMDRASKNNIPAKPWG